jgi:hypothetical protein
VFDVKHSGHDTNLMPLTHSCYRRARSAYKPPARVAGDRWRLVTLPPGVSARGGWRVGHCLACLQTRWCWVHSRQVRSNIACFCRDRPHRGHADLCEVAVARAHSNCAPRSKRLGLLRKVPRAAVSGCSNTSM